MTEHKRGLVFGLAAYGLWGVFPLYWRLLEPSPALEVLAHRVIWSVVFSSLLIAISRQFFEIKAILKRPKAMMWLFAAAITVTINWGVFIYGISIDRVIEGSLGYFINPIFTVLLGVLVLGERLRTLQWIAVVFGFIAIVVFTIDYGHPPYIALALASSFAVYGLIKKQVGVGAVPGLTIEAGLAAPFALGFLYWLSQQGESTVGQISTLHTIAAIGGGVVTAIPLLLFAGAANRIPLSTLGILQYVGPILQFIIGWLIFSEPMTQGRWIGFALVWTAVVVFTWESFAHRRRALAEAAEASAI